MKKSIQAQFTSYSKKFNRQQGDQINQDYRNDEKEEEEDLR